MKNINSIRRDYGDTELREEQVAADPFDQFESWFKQAVESDLLDPTAMLLATVDSAGLPDSRVVLLKAFNHHGFVFYTDYDSPKALQMENQNIVALNFYWREFAKQIRIRGKVQKISRHDSEVYFASRPRESQIGAHVYKQSTPITNRNELETRFEEIKQQFQDQKIPCPDHWGGYRVEPFEFEFFQGRTNRLNDRIRYVKLNNHWKIDRLSP